jgi:hypothetical protein
MSEFYYETILVAKTIKSIVALTPKRSGNLLAQKLPNKFKPNIHAGSKRFCDFALFSRGSDGLRDMCARIAHDIQQLKMYI